MTIAASTETNWCPSQPAASPWGPALSSSWPPFSLWPSQSAASSLSAPPRQLASLAPNRLAANCAAIIHPRRSLSCSRPTDCGRPWPDTKSHTKSARSFACQDANGQMLASTVPTDRVQPRQERPQTGARERPHLSGRPIIRGDYFHYHYHIARAAPPLEWAARVAVWQARSRPVHWLWSRQRGRIGTSH